MLNLRLYRMAWLVAGVAVVVALLTLQPVDPAEEPSIPVVFDGEAALELNDRLEAVAPERAPGTEGGRRGAEWVRQELSSVPGAENRVQVQDFSARSDGRLVRMQNVYLANPGSGGDDGGILIVAPRDTPSGVAAGSSSSAMLVRQARLWAATAHRRPLLFVSTDGSTVGNAGIRWFLSRFSDFTISAAIVLDGPGEQTDNDLHIWASGRSSEAALSLASWAEDSIERAGESVVAYPGLWTQLVTRAVPQTFGDQGPMVSAGIPAVTISGRPDSPPRGGLTVDGELLDNAGVAVADLIASLDETRDPPAPAAEVEVGGQILGPTLARAILLILALPVLVAGADVLSRMRRAGVPRAPGLRGLGRRALPFALLVAVAYGWALVGMFPSSAAGAPPLPDNVPFGATSGLGVALAIGVAVGAFVVGRSRVQAAAPASEAGVAAIALSLLLLVAWVVEPFSLILMLPAAHAALLATAVTRRWQVAALALVGILTPLAACAVIGDRLDRNPAFAAWYLIATTAEGSRGAVGPLIAIAALGCITALAGLAILRARKSLPSRGPDSRARLQAERT